MKERRYDYEGTVYVDENTLKKTAEEFLEKYGDHITRDELYDYLWDYYCDYDNWDKVMDDITDDVFEFYKELTGEEE